VSATGAGTINYQWYEVPQTANGTPVKITANGASASYSPVSTAWGMRSYYCEVSNGFDTIRSNIAQVALGCGAKTNDNRWLRFMCYNLGASAPAAGVAMDEITFAFSGTGANSADTISSDAKGWWFQWSRPADGHQWRRSTAIAGPDTITNLSGASTAKRVGKFITNSNLYTAFDWRYPQYDFFWRNQNDSRFPCPTGWRIPSSSEWGSIYRSGGNYGKADEATSNTWTWIDKITSTVGNTLTGTRGYAVRPDGITTTLFLPAAGYRNYDDAIRIVGLAGLYWSSTSVSDGAYYLEFSSSGVSPEQAYYRANGFSVRCLRDLTKP
jgi:uncharacterized protein (TIGR02145 family)